MTTDSATAAKEPAAATDEDIKNEGVQTEVEEKETSEPNTKSANDDEEEPEDDETDLDDEDDEDLNDTDDEDQDEETASTEAPPIPEGANWSHLGPKLWAALHGLLSGNKTKHDDKYVIEATHEAVEDAHDVLKQ